MIQTIHHKVTKMPKTMKKKFGDKIFTVRAKIPIQIIDWATRQSASLQKLKMDDGDLDTTDPEVMDFNFKFRDEIAKRMVIDPKITPKYMEEEADEDDFALFMFLQEKVGKRIEKRFEHLKE